MCSSPNREKESPVLPGFEGVRRYWDKVHRVYAARIMPGEFYVTCHDEAIITSLGSCVSACVRDRERGIGVAYNAYRQRAAIVGDAPECPLWNRPLAGTFQPLVTDIR